MVLALSARAALEHIALACQSRCAVSLQRVLGALKVAVLNTCVGFPASVVAVGCDSTQVVVIKMGIFQVVCRRVALVGPIEEVMVDGSLCDYIVRPTC